MPNWCLATVRYSFAEALGGVPSHAFQVDRAQFDKLLLEAARGHGAQVHTGESVRQVGF